MNPKTQSMEYYDYLFLYEIIARKYEDIIKQYESILLNITDTDQKIEIQEKITIAEANYNKFWNKAQDFVSNETEGRGDPEGCPPPKRPPCRWPDDPCDSDGLVCIEAQFIENIDQVIPKSDTDSYTIVIRNSNTKNTVVDYTPYSNGYRFFKYQAIEELLAGEKYEFEIIIDDGIGAYTTIIYPFKITP